MSRIISIQHPFSEAKQHLRRHPGNHLSTMLCLCCDRLLSGIHAIKIKNLENKIESFNFSFLDSISLILSSISWSPAFAGVTMRCGSPAKLCLGSPSFRDDDGDMLQEFVEC